MFILIYKNFFALVMVSFKLTIAFKLIISSCLDLNFYTAGKIELTQRIYRTA